MNFITKRPKTWVFISMFVFALSVICLIFAFVNMVQMRILDRMYAVYFRSSINGVLMGFLTYGAFALTAFLCWKKGTNRLLLLACSGALLLRLMVALASQIVQTVRYGMNPGVGNLLLNLLPTLLLSAYIVVFTVWKKKGPMPPLVGAGIAGAAMVIAGIQCLRSLAVQIPILLQEVYLENILSIILNIHFSLADISFWIGVLLLVPLAYYRPNTK